MLFNARGLVFMGRRAGLGDEQAGAWQCPQGGIDADEAPREALFRELEEEIGTRNARLLAEHPAWLRYDLPDDLIGIALKGRYRGQEQRWFALRFQGQDGEIDLGRHGAPEFDAGEWVRLADVTRRVVLWKRPIYAVLVDAFAGYAAR